MKINENQSAHTIVKISQNAGRQAPAEHFPAAKSADRVSFSPKARELIKAQKALANLPDVREDKVGALKARIDEGRYRIDSEGIAAKMIRQALCEKD